MLLIVLVLVLPGVIPARPHGRGWAYGPSGISVMVLRSGRSREGFPVFKGS